jgi:hypothetical protein
MSYAWAVLSVPIEQLERQDQALINCLLAAPGFLTGAAGINVSKLAVCRTGSIRP